MNKKPHISPQIKYSTQKELINALEKLGLQPFLFAVSSSIPHASSRRSPNRPEWSLSRACQRSLIVSPCLYPLRNKVKLDLLVMMSQFKLR